MIPDISILIMFHNDHNGPKIPEWFFLYFTNLVTVRRFGDDSPYHLTMMNQGEEVEQARCQAAPSWLDVKPDAVSLAA